MDRRIVLFIFVYFCLFVCLLFMSHERTFRSRGDVTVVGEGLHRFDLCSAPVAIEQGGIFIVPHLLYVTWGLVFVVTSEKTPKFCRLLRHVNGAVDVFEPGAPQESCLYIAFH